MTEQRYICGLCGLCGSWIEEGERCVHILCLKCGRRLKEGEQECLHGLGPPPEPWDGGLSMTPEELVEEYGISLEDARERLK